MLEQLGEEAGGEPRGGRVRPHGRGQQQRVAGPGEGHVGQPALLLDAVLAAVADEPGRLVLQRLEVGRVPPPQHRQPVAVAAQVVGHPGQSSAPALVGRRAHPPLPFLERRARAGPGGERPLDQTRHRHDVPLQALGGVDREHLDGVRRHLDGALVEPALLGLRGVEPGQEPAQRGPVGAAGEVGRDVGERVEVRAGRGRGVLGPGQDLDVEAERALGLADQVGQRHAGQRAQPAHGLAQPEQALPGHG